MLLSVYLLERHFENSLLPSQPSSIDALQFLPISVLVQQKSFSPCLPRVSVTFLFHLPRVGKRDYSLPRTVQLFSIFPQLSHQSVFVELEC